jgi:hypothetical protein
MAHTRADRRHYEEVMKARARRIYKQSWKWSTPSPRAVGILAHNLKRCSCEMCCNLRGRNDSNWEKLTPQERRDRDETQYELQDIA